MQDPRSLELDTPALQQQVPWLKASADWSTSMWSSMFCVHTGYLQVLLLLPTDMHVGPGGDSTLAVIVWCDRVYLVFNLPENGSAEENGWMEVTLLGLR